MDIFVPFLAHPIIFLALKMLAISVILWVLHKQLVSARAQANLWRNGLLFLMLLPLFHQQIMWLDIPVLTQNMLPAEDGLHRLSSVDIQTAIASRGDDYLNLIGLMVAAISTWLLLQFVAQLSQLKKITQQAKHISHQNSQLLVNTISQQMGLKNLPEVLISKQVQSPCTWGRRYPVILLPTHIDPSDLKVVLTHEMAHIKRHDWSWLMVSKVITCVFWFNPMLWLIKNRMIACFEDACDEMVLKQGIQPSHYAETLIKFHTQQTAQHQAITTMMAQSSVMFLRLQHILKPHPEKPIMKNKQKISFILTATAAVLISTTQISWAQDQETPQPDAVLHAPPHLISQSTPQPSHSPVAPVAPAANTAPAAPTPVHPPHSEQPDLYLKAPVAPTVKSVQPPQPSAELLRGSASVHLLKQQIHVEQLRQQAASQASAAETKLQLLEQQIATQEQQLRLKVEKSHLAAQTQAQQIEQQQRIEMNRIKSIEKQIRAEEIKHRNMALQASILEHQARKQAMAAEAKHFNSQHQTSSDNNQ